MENKELEEVVLPVQLLEMIALEADEVTKEKSKGGSKDFALGFHHGYFIGATEWAQWKVKHDEERQQRVHLEKENDVITANYNALKERCDKMEAALKQFISYHETGLLPDIFTYKKGIEALQGESNTLAPGEGEKEVGDA